MVQSTLGFIEIMEKGTPCASFFVLQGLIKAQTWKPKSPEQQWDLANNKDSSNNNISITENRSEACT